ncbi:Ribokinase-like protein [Kockiozyma suomiensis]|uniref:Ribokinase-like protein n=1 Tax=Kockiozyma suomiensis TaxID=1337062 RepID=UPI003342FC09
MPDGLYRILDISSHVVHGYVGNRASTFPLQLLEWDVDVLNTVAFSNHTGYMQWKGERATASQIRDIYEGLKSNTLTDYDVILSGYIPGAEAVREVGRVVEDLRRDQNDSPYGRDEIIWVLDPVMGDEDKLYVSPDVVPAYESLLPLATVITPNQFETELLTGTKLTSEADIFTALTTLHNKFHTPNIIISSAVPTGSGQQSSSSGKGNDFICAGQTFRSDGSACQFFLRLPFIDAYFTGTGDLFASMVADKFFKHTRRCHETYVSKNLTIPDHDLPLVRTLEDVSAIVQAVLRKTADAVALYDKQAELAVKTLGVARPEKGTKERRIADMKHGELRLIQSQDAFKNTHTNVKAQFYSA